MKKTKRSISSLAALAFALTQSPDLWAAPIGIGATNTATITHDPGFGTPIVTGPFAIPNGSYNNTVTGGPGGASSSGTGGISWVMSPTLFGLNFPVGTGVSQTAPGGNVNPASLKIDFDIDFLMDGGGFGPNPYELYNFNLVGNVAGPGDYVQFILNADGYLASTGQQYGVGWHATFSDSTPGPFATQLFNMTGPYASLVPNESFKMIGSITFIAFDPDGPTDISLKSGGMNVPDAGSSLSLMSCALAGVGFYRRLLSRPLV